MGDRGNIKIGDVYLYTHWGGSRVQEVAQKALARRQRWDDEPYLTRIVFCEMLPDGISTYICDNEHPIVELNCDSQRVYIDGEDAGSFEEWANASSH